MRGRERGINIPTAWLGRPPPVPVGGDTPVVVVGDAAAAAEVLREVGVGGGASRRAVAEEALFRAVAEEALFRAVAEAEGSSSGW